MYEITFDAATVTLRLRLTGFWTVETVGRFADELLATVRRLVRTAPDLVIISDCTDYPVQSAQVSAAYAERLGPSAGMRQPCAMVVTSSVSRLQAARLAGAPTLRAFATFAEAEAWLDSMRPHGDRPIA